MSPAGSKNAPEAKAREKIDALLAQAGWLVQDREEMNLTAGDAIAVREFKLEKGHGYVDYLLFVDGNALGVVEAKSAGFYTRADDTKPSTLRARLRAMPPVELPGLWPNKVQAIVNLEKSLFDNRPRALIQMATGTGKTLLAVTEIYRLIKFGGARRV